MTTQLAFAFGMLTVVSIAMVVGIIVSLLKAYKLKSEMKDVISYTQKVTDNTDRRLDDIFRELNSSVNATGENAHIRMDSIYTDMEKRFDDLYRHVDSRFDKFENKITGSKEKQLLKN